MKLEIGGGLKPLKDGWVNLDHLPCADIVFNLDLIPPGRLPFADESVDCCYSSHCFEHLVDPVAVMVEVARVCRLGAEFEMRVPHPQADLAMVPGHRYVLAPIAIRNVTHHFIGEYWPRDKCPRRLVVEREEYSPSCYFDHLRGLYPAWSDEDVLRFAPRAAHDIRYHFRVIAND